MSTTAAQVACQLPNLSWKFCRDDSCSQKALKNRSTFCRTFPGLVATLKCESVRQPSESYTFTGKHNTTFESEYSQSSDAFSCSAMQAVSAPTYDSQKQGQFADEEDFLKAGGSDIHLVQLQASKQMDQVSMGSKLPKLDVGEKVLDLVVIGCGPAGLSLAAESAKRGLSVALIGPDVPFVNNYGVWADEFNELGLSHCLDLTWRDAALYLESNEPIMVGRPYGRVNRKLLRDELLEHCVSGGVQYLNAEVENIEEEDESSSQVVCKDGSRVQCRLVTVASGAASGKFLKYESGAKGVGVQTAYGIEVEVENYPYDPSVMHFMDYRDFDAINATFPEEKEFENVPSFLYAMPVSSTRVFFEETCLAARPAMPFEVLKDRLQRRLKFLRISYTTLHEEEWSYIPVGGSLPSTNQRNLGFGAAASMIHPATGYSIARSLKEAPAYAEAIALALSSANGRTIQAMPHEAAVQAWNSLWSSERKKQRAFMIFGLELILQLDLAATRNFFQTFFQLPEWLWRGFLGSSLSSVDLIWFALVTFVIAPNSLRFALVRHLVLDPSGASLAKAYLGLESEPKSSDKQVQAALHCTFLAASMYTAMKEKC